MIRRTVISSCITACCLTVIPAIAAETVEIVGRVSAVTVYQGQALVTRDVELPEVQGLLEAVVTNLPENVIPGSLFAEPAGGVQIRSVRFRARPVEEDVRKEVRELDEQIQTVDDQLAAIREERNVLHARKSYLTQLEQFSAVTSQLELKSGVLNADTLQTLTEFLFAQRNTISKRELELAQEERQRNHERDLLSRKRDTITAGSSRTVREAVVFISAPERGAARLRLSYLVSNASWSPSYNVRANAARDEVSIEYNASIQQMSGEDWHDVDMTLSTATPSLVAAAPKLEPLVIKLGQLAVAKEEADSLSSSANYALARRQLAQLSKLRGYQAAQADAASPAQVADRFKAADLPATASAPSGAMGGAGGVGSWDLSYSYANTQFADQGLNRAARDLQLLDFNNSLSEIRAEQKQSRESTEGVSVSYRLANRTSLPSRSDRQLIQIAALPLKGDFYRLATPVLTDFVYDEARLTNASDLVFLAGPVATFLGGEFVGRGDLPTIAVGESFTVGLGIDSSLRSERTLVDKSERIQGGNRVVDFTYELAIENFGDKATKVRLIDRLPTVGEDDIKVTLVKSDVPVSDDSTYQLMSRKNGILRWDVEVPAQAMGAKRKVIRYTMQIEYDKQLSIVGMPNKA